jgi:hypothetical protein
VLHAVSANERNRKTRKVTIQVGEASPDRDQFLREHARSTYEYEYDSHGNWTQQTGNIVDPSAGLNGATVASQRKLTYY